MAKKKKAKRVAGKRKASKPKKAKKRSGFGKKGFSMDTVGKMIFSSALLRAGSGAVYYFTRQPGKDGKPLIDSSKIKIAVPAAVAFASAKGYIPHMEGLTAMAVDQATQATIENVDFLRDIFDLKFLDKKATAKPVAGLNPRSAAEMARRLNGLTLRSGLVTNPSASQRGNLTISNRFMNRARPANRNGLRINKTKGIF